MPDITYDVGRVSFIMKGAWNLATSYEKLDAVSYGGSLYIAKQDVPGGTAITNTTYWQLAAEKGDKGDTGGVDSVNGQQGDVWFPDSRQLISDGYTTDTDPFLTKGNDSDSDRFELAKKLGNTVGVNQLVNPAKLISSSGTGWTMTANGDGTMTLVVTTAITTQTNVNLTANSSTSYLSVPAGHKFIFHSPTTRPGNSIFRDGYAGAGLGWNTINEKTGSSPILLQLALRDVPTGTYKIVPLFNDLTLWYGSNDRIPSDLLSHPENWGRYYAGALAYNAGTLESADGTVLKSIGRNVWDEEWELGYYNNSDGGKASSSTCIRSKNKIRVLPNTTYFFHASNRYSLRFYDSNEGYLGRGSQATYASDTTFTTPSDCVYMAFYMEDSYGTTYGNNITISLYYPGESGYDQYYPYSVLAEVDTGSETLYAYDEKAPDGTIYRNTLRIDLGTLSYTALSGGNNVFFANVTGVPNDTGNGNMPKLKCAKYVTTTAKNATTWAAATDDKVISLGYDSARIYFRDTAFSDASLIPAALSGVYIEVKAATPTTEQGTAFDPLVVTVQGGVLSWTNTKGIPVGHESHFFENLRKRVEDRLPDPPSADGTYRLTCTISGGVKTYSWEA